MQRKLLYWVPIVAALAVGFVLGHHHLSLQAANTKSILYYVDPMHPSYRSDKPGIAPDCGMQLVPVYAEDAGKPLLAPAGPRTLSIDSATRQLYGIQLAKVENSAGHGTMRVFGRVAADETRIFHLNLGAAGYVKSTAVDAVGTHVSKNQRLAVVYSSEVLYAAAGYLTGNARIQAGAMRDMSPAMQGKASVSTQADYLRNLGMSDAQIDELNVTQKVPEEVYIVSPVDGFVLSRNISPGLRFEKETEFYTIADLSHVWIVAEVLGQDAHAFRPGSVVRVSLPDGGASFSARVSDVLPQVDPTTRTMKLRLIADNPGFRLRPDMFVSVDLPVDHPEGLTIPAEALLDSGLSKRVFLQTSAGTFEPREVETGWRQGDRVEIVKGLREGDTIVSAGTFLVDSESRLHTVAMEKRSN